MKKIFLLQQENKNPDRLLEAVKNEVRSYLKRERRKSLPEGATFWEFDCLVGQSKENNETVTASGIIKALDQAREANWERCYISIEAKPSFKKRAVPEVGTEAAEPSTDEKIEARDNEQ